MLMFNHLKRQCRKQYKFYKKELSNFETVMRDTNNSLVIANQYDYNCMSYALGVFDKWLGLQAFHNTLIYNEITNDNDIDYVLMDDVFNACCEELEERFAVRRISNPTTMLKENERMIAFRIGADDFHFARRNSDGVWTHKPGCAHIREMSEDELFDRAWSEDSRCFPYISNIAFFAVKI